MASSDPQRVVEEEWEDDDDKEERWVKHYSSCHEILLVGEGDFSFSLALANAFGSASNIVATSLDSHDTVVTKYAKAKSNLETLEKMGAIILHGVDATKMKLHTDLKMRKFDRIVYNFPHAGFRGKEDQIQLINLHRRLVLGFFDNASHMLRLNGEVHVTHKTEIPYNKWKLEELASRNSLVLIECADFCINDYPGYNNKRGDGVNCDQPFRLGECCTYKFVIDIHGKKKARKMRAAISHMIAVHGTRAGGSWNTPAVDHSLDIRHSQADYMPHIVGRTRLMCSPQINGSRSQFPIDVEHMPTRVYATAPGIQTSSFQQHNFSIGLEGISRQIANVPQASFDTLMERIPRKILSPPRIFSSAASGVFEDRLADFMNTVRRIGPDFRHGDQGVMISDYEPRIGIGNSYSMAFGDHSEDLRNIIRRYGPAFSSADQVVMRNGREPYMRNDPCSYSHLRHPGGLNYWPSHGPMWPQRTLLREAREAEDAWVW